MRVVWTENARSQLNAIYAYIAVDSIRYATAMIDRLTGRSQQIGRHPESGGVVAEYERSDIREVVAYRIIYRIGADQIDVLSIVHGAHQLPPDVAE